MKATIYHSVGLCPVNWKPNSPCKGRTVTDSDQRAFQKRVEKRRAKKKRK